MNEYRVWAHNGMVNILRHGSLVEADSEDEAIEKIREGILFIAERTIIAYPEPPKQEKAK